MDILLIFFHSVEETIANSGMSELFDKFFYWNSDSFAYFKEVLFYIILIVIDYGIGRLIKPNCRIFYITLLLDQSSSDLLPMDNPLCVRSMICFHCILDYQISTNSPACSSRYLLNDSTFFDVFPDLEPAPALPPIESPRFQPIKRYESAVLRPSTSTSPRLQPLTREESVVRRPSTSAPPRLQQLTKDESAALRPPSSTQPQDKVVILKVSLHCKGCEGKVRKHISKMEGNNG